MKSVNFPNMINGNSTNIIEDSKATANNLKLLVGSNQGELFGDPFYGPALKKHFFNQNGKILKDVVTDELYTQIKIFMPQLYVERKNIQIIQDGRGRLVANIRAVDQGNYQNYNYSLVLFQNGE